MCAPDQPLTKGITMRDARYGQRRDGARLGRYSLGAVLSLALLALGPPALADTPTFIHDQIDAHFSEPGFCGSGITVDVVVSGVQTIRLRGEDVQVTGRVRAVVTNPQTGASVVVSSAGQVRDEIVSGDAGGVHTHLLTFKGLPEKIQTAGGEVLLRDAGVIAFADTFDGHHLLSSEVVVNKGPHPEADADFALFCSTMVSALA